MSESLSVTVVYLDEGDEEGGIAHPTQDLIAALQERVEVDETIIERNRSSNPWYWYSLGREAAAGSDLVHIQFEYGSFGDIGGMFLGSMFPFFALGVDVPMVSTLHNFRDRRVDVSLANPGSLVRFLAEHATWFVDRSLVMETDFFVPLMKEEQQLLERFGVSPNAIEHIPLVPETNPEFRDRDVCKRELGLDGQRVVTAFGWVRRTKGYDRVLEILDDLPDDVLFLVAGGTRTDRQAEYLEELRELASSHGLDDRVRFTGYVGREEHSTIMNATDVMVFPYRDNRASDALARALAYHIPIVTSDNSEFNAFEERWDCVRTVSNDRELSAEVRTLLESDTERERLSERAQQFCSEMNWDSVTDDVVDIYRSLTDH